MSSCRNASGGLVHLQDRLGVDGVGRLQCGLHCPDISDDQAGIPGGVLGEFGNAICRAPLVRFWISELDALSVRSRMDAKGAVM